MGQTGPFFKKKTIDIAVFLWYNGGVTTPAPTPRDYDTVLTRKKILKMLIGWAENVASSHVTHHDVWPIASMFRLKRIDLTNED